MSNNGGVYTWSQTANNNASADNTVNWAEGQAPSSVNNSARGMMASVAKYRDDISGMLVTSGISTAYTVSSFQDFDSLTDMAGQMIAFTPHTTNGAVVTLNVDGLGPKPLRTAPGVELVAGTIIQGTPYRATYNNTDGAFYLHGFFGNPYVVPIGAGMDFWGSTAPNSCFAFPMGQAISRTAYPAAYAVLGTSYGPGDGSTTFNLPDKRGRVTAALDNMGGVAANRLSVGYFGANTGFAATSLGAYGGLESHTQTLAETPTGIISQNNSQFNISVASPLVVDTGQNTFATNNSGQGFSFPAAFNQSITSTGTVQPNTISSTSNNTGGAPHANVQPTIVCNYIIRIL